MVRSRVPAKPMNSVFVRELRAGNLRKGGPAAGMVRARVPAKPMNSVFGRELRAGKLGKGGPDALEARNLTDGRWIHIIT